MHYKNYKNWEEILKNRRKEKMNALQWNYCIKYLNFLKQPYYKYSNALKHYFRKKC